MDETSERDAESPTGGTGDEDQVGLGRVVEDRRPPAERGDASDPEPGTKAVEEASEDSFPASDPPPFTSASGG